MIDQLSTVQQVLVSDTQTLVANSKKLVTEIETAKTKTKRTYYTRKLRKNNVKLAELLIGLEKIKKKKELKHVKPES